MRRQRCWPCRRTSRWRVPRPPAMPPCIAAWKRAAPLARRAEPVRQARRGGVVWTWDTAAGLLTGPGSRASRVLTGYLSPAAFAGGGAAGLIGEPQGGGIAVEPLYRRPAM